MTAQVSKWKYMPSKSSYPHPLEWPSSRTLTAANGGKDVEQQERSRTAGGNANAAATLEGGVEASYTTKHT